jgi:hypothetical protein
MHTAVEIYLWGYGQTLMSLRTPKRHTYRACLKNRKCQWQCVVVLNCSTMAMYNKYTSQECVASSEIWTQNDDKERAPAQ